MLKSTLLLKTLLAWYVLFWIGMSFAPVDGQNWILSSILPCLLVAFLVATHRAFPFSHGAREILAWHDADPARRVVDEKLERVMERIVEAQEAVAKRK
jgi:hypothetical protein